MSIKTSIGTPTADSYVSVASADAYLEAKENSESWLDIDDNATTGTAATTRKENLLKQATREIDNSFRFQSSKYNQGIRGESDYQALEFPRLDNTDSDANIYIPDEVKWSTYEQALWLLDRANLKTDEDGKFVKFKMIADIVMVYLKGWIMRQVNKWGNNPWQKSRY